MLKPTDPVIEWTQEKAERLAKARQVAIDNGFEKFPFEGHLFLVSYTKYLLEYLEMINVYTPRKGASK